MAKSTRTNFSTLYCVSLSSESFVSELLFISQSRKSDQLVSLSAACLETNTVVSGLPGCPFIAAQPPFDQSPITIQPIDQRILSFYLCLFSVGPEHCETERRWLPGRQKTLLIRKGTERLTHHLLVCQCVCLMSKQSFSLTYPHCQHSAG